jgi:tetratricopeptide (TPR) repeat protein
LHSLGPLVEAGAFPDVARAVRGRLDDASRSVRYQAAWALRGSLDMSSLAGRELVWALDFNADQPTGQMQKGVLALARNQPDAALPHYLRAVEWDPNSPPLRHELAVVYSMLGEPEKALAQMREASRLNPDEAEYRYKLGLALNEIGELAEAAAAMEMAVALDPGHGRAWYNLGLARNQLGQVESALEALIRGENARPDDPGIPYARATILAQIGRYAEARQAAQRALEVDPAHAAARGLLSSLP